MAQDDGICGMLVCAKPAVLIQSAIESSMYQIQNAAGCFVAARWGQHSRELTSG